ncbi:hypothetical protein SE17_27190 [Kouleothrix aurantiaca]|uniref:Uncharacterized protein n=1 Tax=Kouleothrix aurantiaca TaxID=186479 RepID=A0A0N8PRN2_9CHLR|nr:hypothetical protein SE17_27190 [Kouleothrix aurantiaca]
MHRRKLLDGFKFDQETLFDEQISAKSLLELYSLKHDWHRILPLHVEPTLRKRMGQHNFINRFEQAWPKASMYLEATIDGDTCEFFKFHRLLPLSHAKPRSREDCKNERKATKNHLCLTRSREAAKI